MFIILSVQMDKKLAKTDFEVTSAVRVCVKLDPKPFKIAS